MTLTIELVNCTQVFLQEIASSQVTQKSVALTYAMALSSSYATDWAKVNEAIVSRWSMSGLERIKKAAWKLHEERVGRRGRKEHD